MAEVTVGRWARNLAVRVPSKIARAVELSEGERVEIEVRDGDIVIHRPAVRMRADAEAAAEKIIDESGNHPLGALTIRELLDEGGRR